MHFRSSAGLAGVQFRCCVFERKTCRLSRPSKDIWVYAGHGSELKLIVLSSKSANKASYVLLETTASSV
jgi:hypothetical protein